MAPFVLLMKGLSSSKDLIPEKSNFMVRLEISLSIFEILRELTSSSSNLLLIFWSKSFIRDLSNLIFTFNFSSALAKWRILFKFLD